MELTETIKKSAMTAKGEQDLGKLKNPGSLFLSVNYQEEQEEIIFYYDIQEKNNYLNLRQEKKINKLRALLSIAELQTYFLKFHFSLAPENLFYDRNFMPYVKSRDLYERGVEGECETFVKEYKALVAAIMQKKYSFRDYLEGGDDLYKKNRFLKGLGLLSTPEEIVDYLKAEYETAEDISRNKKIEVNKNWYRMNSTCMLVAFAVIVAAVIGLSYLVFQLLPRKNALLDASSHYLEGNYVKVIDDLNGIDLKYMDKYQKYMLAVSYVKGENLTPEQKENVLETLSIDGEEKVKDYWIYLGRLNTVEAQNIAMQRSDNEMLLYAYMTEKAMLEKNTQITGEEKANRLSELENKIEELAKQYEETTNTK
ncbi:MAG: hypothetical protein IKY23_01625 [Lachnospiraceae bacterium]|nr:hypothetical protein [Lachnospiraceae bacterium]